MNESGCLTAHRESSRPHWKKQSEPRMEASGLYTSGLTHATMQERYWNLFMKLGVSATGVEGHSKKATTMNVSGAAGTSAITAPGISMTFPTAGGVLSGRLWEGSFQGDMRLKEYQTNIDSWSEMPGSKEEALQRLTDAVQIVKDLDLLDRNPNVQALLEGLAEDPMDKRLWETLVECIKPFLFVNSVKPNPFSVPPPGVLTGELYIGKADDGNLVFIRTDDLLKGIFVAGTIGTGKTNLLQIIAAQLVSQGVSTFWFDTQKKCGLYLTRAFPQMLYLSMSDLRYNPFEWIPGCTDKKKPPWRPWIFFRGSTIY
ncbi:hypothetical protein MUP95_07335 [bacterium]|nr:hypothetical protein [bacterium]